MSYDRLPPGLKEETTFCLYKLEPGKDGKKKKVPYQTCGARADPGNKAHLTDFTTAYEIYCNGGYDGIGLSVAEDMEAVDIDDCVVDGKINNKVFKAFLLFYPGFAFLYTTLDLKHH